MKLAQLINPKVRKVIFYSWDSVKPLNDFFQSEIRAACKATGIELAEFKLLASAEDEFDFLATADRRGPDHFILPGVDVWVHRDGSPANMTVEGAEFMRKNIRNIPMYSYDEAAVKAYYPAGTCVIWYDLGAQMADKAM